MHGRAHTHTHIHTHTDAQGKDKKNPYAIVQGDFQGQNSSKKIEALESGLHEMTVQVRLCFCAFRSSAHALPLSLAVTCRPSSPPSSSFLSAVYEIDRRVRYGCRKTEKTGGTSRRSRSIGKATPIGRESATGRMISAALTPCRDSRRRALTASRCLCSPPCT